MYKSVHICIIQEGNETFGVFLYNPTGSSHLGNQWKTVVTIVDDDYGSLSMDESITDIAIEQLPFTSVFYLSNSTSSKVLKVEKDESLFVVAESLKRYALISFITFPIIHEGKTGYDLKNIDIPGIYKVHVFRMMHGGLVGSYFTDLMLSKLEKTRVDSNLNFTWSEKNVKSARWEGFITLNETQNECCTFYISGKNVRLWVNRYLVIDEWNHVLDKEVQFSGFYSLKSSETVEVMIEVRHINFASSITLMMSENDTSQRVFPSNSLLWKVRLEPSNSYALVFYQLSDDDFNCTLNRTKYHFLITLFDDWKERTGLQKNDESPLVP
jgi:hypothetical protein